MIFFIKISEFHDKINELKKILLWISEIHRNKRLNSLKILNIHNLYTFRDYSKCSLTCYEFHKKHL